MSHSAVAFGMSYAIASAQGDGSDWLYVDHDLAATRYSHLKQITTKNVSVERLLGIFLIPSLFVFVERLVERKKLAPRRTDEELAVAGSSERAAGGSHP